MVLAGLFWIGTNSNFVFVLVARNDGMVGLWCGLKSGTWRSRNGLVVTSLVRTLGRPAIPLVTLCGPRGIRLRVGLICLRLAWFS